LQKVFIMQYPLPERIGDPDLLVGRAKEFRLLEKWLNNIPKLLSKSRVILARRKSGKTAIVQRIFNRLWSADDLIVPFYFSITETKKWFPEFAIEYYCAFASQYISFSERDPAPIDRPFTMAQIREYGVMKAADLFVHDVDSMKTDLEMGFYGLMWKTAYTAPERFANFYKRRALVIIDEFQNITQYVYMDRKRQVGPDKTLAGSFHDVVESKSAPMLVTGSYVGWLIEVISRYLQAGRLKRQFMNPYLTPEEGLQAVYKYAESLDEPITNETAEQINTLCMSDPFFISCVVQSEYEDKDLTTEQGVVNTTDYEITDPSSEMSMNWAEYIDQTTDRINERYAKNILLHLSKHADRDWTPSELKDELGLDISEIEIRKKLEIMAKADVITKGRSDIDFRGIRDGTIYLILRNRFEKEISGFAPKFKDDFTAELEQLKKHRNSLQGRLNNLVGKFAEFQLFTDFRTRQCFPLSVYFDGVKDCTQLNVTEVRMRDKFQRADGKEMEIDVRADSACGRTVLVEVKKTGEKIGIAPTRKFVEKAEAFAKRFPKKKILPVFLSVGGFTGPAMRFCQEHGIGTAERIHYFQKD